MSKYTIKWRKKGRLHLANLKNRVKTSRMGKLIQRSVKKIKEKFHLPVPHEKNAPHHAAVAPTAEKNKIIAQMMELKTAFKAAADLEYNIAVTAKITIKQAGFFEWKKKKTSRQEARDAQLRSSRMDKCAINIQRDIRTLKKAFRSAAGDKEKGQTTVLSHLGMMHDAMKAWATGTRTETYQEYAAKLAEIKGSIAAGHPSTPSAITPSAPSEQKPRRYPKPHDPAPSCRDDVW